MKAKSNNYRGKVDISVSQNFITSKNTIYKFNKNYFRRLMVLQSQNIVEYIEKIENSFSFKKFPHMSSRY